MSIDRELSEGFNSPIYSIVSNDEFLLNDTARLIKKSVLQDEFNFEDYDLSFSDNKISINGLMESLNMIPFMSGRKVVFIRHSENFTKKELEALNKYFSNPSPFSLLVLFFKVSDLRKNLPLANQNIKTLVVSLSGREFVKWIDNRTRQLGYKLTKNAIDYLINVTGTDVGIINAELQKFNALNKQSLDIADISSIIYSGADYGAFELIDKIKQGDLKKSIQLLQRLDKEIETYQLLGALCWDLVVKQEKIMDIKYIKDALKILHEADMLSKKSALCVMETTIVRLVENFKRIQRNNN
ncbi:MAG TPA: DNA polymerase III subunit delta [Nitrospirae bacterium]|nr:DNA polymerase III subunit delta [Nitrospirota bacterium]